MTTFSLYALVLLLTAMQASPASIVLAEDRGGGARLVLQLTVDGLRADLLTRNADRFADGGFRYLLEQGTVLLSRLSGLSVSSPSSADR